MHEMLVNIILIILISFGCFLLQVYPCVSDCLGNIFPQKLDYVIITTKQERFVKAILEKNVITPPVPENIYDLDNPFGAKTKVFHFYFNKCVCYYCHYAIYINAIF